MYGKVKSSKGVRYKLKYPLFTVSSIYIITTLEMIYVSKIFACIPKITNSLQDDDMNIHHKNSCLVLSAGNGTTYPLSMLLT